jgi:hypothetical protein
MAKLREKKTVINGICADAVELLKEKPITPKALRVMKRVKGLRQIEMAELMISANNYTLPYAQALYLATPEDQLVYLLIRSGRDGRRARLSADGDRRDSRG